MSEFFKPRNVQPREQKGVQVRGFMSNFFKPSNQEQEHPKQEFGSKSDSHTSEFISWVQKNRREENFCDVFVKTSDGHIVPAHSLVLSYSSEYLRNLIEKRRVEWKVEGKKKLEDLADSINASRNYFHRTRSFNRAVSAANSADRFTIEVDIEWNVFTKCLNFMYWEKLEVTMETVEDILKASEKLNIPKLPQCCSKFLEERITMSTCADILQLSRKYASISMLGESCCEFLETKISEGTCADILELSLKYASISRLEESCCDFWENNISVENCLDMIERSRKYGKIDLREIAEIFVINNLMTVSGTSRFHSVQKADLIRYIENSNVGGDVIWKILSVWIPSNSSNICGGILKEMVPKQAQNADLSAYMLEHFDDLTKQDLFPLLGKEDISFLLFSPDLVCSSEDCKLQALLHWNRRQGDLIRRRPCITAFGAPLTNPFDELFESIKPQDLSFKFIIDLLKEEPLIKDNEKRRMLLLDSLAKSKQETLPNTSRDQTSKLCRKPWQSLSMAADSQSPRSVRSPTPSETSNSTISSFTTACSIQDSDECKDFYETARFSSKKKY